jgi:cation-transporting ATPase 13A1
MMMIVDLAGCWVIEKVCKHLFADLEPKEMITRGRERRERRRKLEEEEKMRNGGVIEDKKTQ